ncbi:glycosyltransferase family 4 protein [Halobacillus amylolyticus]|uniref:Glycosyltransferase family 4 protein n=1 Tax=Halobacillus amylolyticus TaxID=2932259 RepID=A0ABY4H9W5_9BACI|nr:glycosyltransferase family 4 protein [Halobacillus amylolyticus]UOR11649.1 glycosyltransferase family 4 protein [Halobacillus amylolyticus]
MNILVTTIFDYPHEGGLSSHVTTLKKGLEARGHHVDVLSFTQLPNLKKKLFAQGPGYVMNRFSPGKGQLMNDLQRRKLLEQAIKHQAASYDVINSQDVFSTLASLQSGIPVVATIHGYYAYEAISRGAVQSDSETANNIRSYEQQAYRSANANITVDQRIRDYVKETSGADAHVVRNFIDTEQFLNSSTQLQAAREKYNIPIDHTMLFVPRRLTEKNGVIYPLLALKEVVKQHPETALVYAGTGEQMTNMKQKIIDLNLEKHVYLLGSVPHGDMVELYQTASIVLIPSVHSHGVEEATSISALEAMGSGTPVIAGAVGGLKELITHQEDGLLFGDRDEQELSKHISYLIEHKEAADTLSQAAQMKIRSSFSHLAAAERFEKTYSDAVEQQSTRSN